MFLILLAALLGPPGTATLQANSGLGVGVFVGPQTREGFVDVDKGILDAIKRIENELRGRKGLRVVNTREEAQLILEVLSFGATSPNGGGAVGVPVGNLSVLLPIEAVGISTVLRVGTYEKPIVLKNCGHVRRCAKLAANDVETWVKANPSVALQKP